MQEESNSAPYLLLFLLFNIFLVLLKGTIVEGNSLDRDTEVLLSLKSFLEQQNQVNRGRYSQWNQLDSTPCDWPGINCSLSGAGAGAGIRVTAVDLSSSSISGEIFGNFSALTALSRLDLSQNTIHGQIPSDLGSCKTLKYLNLTHNLIGGKLNVSGLSILEVLDLSVNRFQGEIQLTFPAICGNLKVVNISTNNFTGHVDECFEQCWDLGYLDLSANQFTGQLWNGFARMKEFSVSENWLSGLVSPSFFSGNCNLQILDLSENQFDGEVPLEISNCKSLSALNLWGNHFKGKIPSSLGSVSSLQTLVLGNNNFSRDLPESLLNCTNLTFLDLSRNNFGGDIPPIFGRLSQLMYIVLHANSFTGGIISSGILKLPNISRLDLSYNNFSGPLPVEISKVGTMQFLVLAYNRFSGAIPPEYGSLNSLQVLDLSFNRLTGSIPSTFGNLKSLLWLMLANNSLTGQIPRELGNCNSLLWLNLANNRFNGTIPQEITKIGANPTPTFRMNRNDGPLIPGSGECLVMRRWIPADYPPFSFVYALLTRKSCRSIWDRILKGYGLFPVCNPGSSVRTLQISGYLQLSGNQFSGEVPQHIGRMQNFSMFHLSGNRFSGALPSDIGNLPLVVLNVSQNGLSGVIPSQIGNLKCLQNLDLSYNNFSGTFPTSLNNLNELSKFNVSYNPLISGVIPSTGQLATFDKYSFLGDPLLHLPSFLNSSSPPTLPSPKSGVARIRNKGILKQATFFIFLILVFVFLICGAFTILVCTLIRGPEDTQRYLLQNRLRQHDSSSSSSVSSPWLSDTVKVSKTPFTHADILKATGNFSEDNIIGTGGFGTVYRGILPDGRQVAVKRQQREGMEGEREFRAEMEVFCGNSAIWPHPNLVTLYGWCLDGSQKILIYEYMEGGSLEDLISDQTKLNWRRRIDIAIDVARALVFLHHECYPAIVHRDVKASNILLDKNGKATVTDFGLARIVDTVDSHVSTIVAGTVGYVAPEYSQTWQATTKGDVYSFGVLAMELATGRRAVDGGEECLVEQVRRVTGNGQLGSESSDQSLLSTLTVQSEGDQGKEEMCELLRIGLRCTAETPQARPNMKEVLSMLVKVSGQQGAELSSKFSVSS